MDEIGAIAETGGAAVAELAVTELLGRGGKVNPCANCGAPVIGVYCSICGQPCDTHRRSVLHLFHDFVKDIASFDSRILRTARALLFEPGELPKAFREGRTQPYVPAVRLYLFVSLLFFLFLSVTGIAFLQFGVHYQSLKFVHDSAGRVYKIENGRRTLVAGLRSDAQGNVSLGSSSVLHLPIPNLTADGKSTYNIITNRPVFFRRPGDVDLKLPPATRRQIAKLEAAALKKSASSNWFNRGVYNATIRLETDPAALNGPLLTWIPRILFFLLPLFAVLLAAFYWRRRREFYFVDHLVFSLSVHTFAFIVLIAAAAAAQAVNEVWVTILMGVALAAYLLLALKRFYGESWLRTGWKFAAVGFIYPVFFLLPALGFAVIASMVEG